MNISILEPDIAPSPVANVQASSGGNIFGTLLNAATQDLDDAQQAERAFVQGSGSLLAMTTARAKSDVDLSIAAATASRVAQAVSTFANMSL